MPIGWLIVQNCGNEYRAYGQNGRIFLNFEEAMTEFESVVRAGPPVGCEGDPQPKLLEVVYGTSEVIHPLSTAS